MGKVALRKNAKGATQEDVARKCKLDQGSVSRILNKDTRDSFSEETVRRVIIAARELGYLHPSLVASNRRQSARKKAAVMGHVRVVIGTNTIYDEGEVEIDNISLFGMLLRNFRTTTQSLPMDRFKLDVEITRGKLNGLRARCKVVRFSIEEDGFALAVKFESLNGITQKKLSEFIETKRLE